jgi:hypothetical protein
VTRSSRLRILVSGMVAGDPGQGGASWAVLQYVLGFRALGHDVHLVEPVDDDSILPPGRPLDRSDNASYFGRLVERFDLGGRAALLRSGTTEALGVPHDRLRRLARDADVLINMSGMLTDPSLMDDVPVRVYLDLDPAFTQLWHAVEGIDMRFEGHTHFVTVGQSIGDPSCPVPTAGRRWIPTLPPVVLSRWPVAHRIERDAWTTVGNWRGYGSIEHDGLVYGQKAHSLRQLTSLPGLTGQRFLLAMAIHPDETPDLSALAESGWELADPVEVAGTPHAYRRFIQGSRGEFGIAKSGYVLSRCGWFSDRSACYLASGRPVIAQETGFSSFLPVGKGLLAFEGPGDVVEAIEAVNADYPGHSRAARSIAEEHLDAGRVLGVLLERVATSS